MPGKGEKRRLKKQKLSEEFNREIEEALAAGEEVIGVAGEGVFSAKATEHGGVWLTTVEGLGTLGTEKTHAGEKEEKKQKKEELSMDEKLAQRSCYLFIEHEDPEQALIIGTLTYRAAIKACPELRVQILDACHQQMDMYLPVSVSNDKNNN